jgi:hypothetical protein
MQPGNAAEELFVHTRFSRFKLHSKKLKEMMEHATQFPEEFSKVAGERWA